MSVLMTAGKKAAQAKAEKEQRKKKKAAAAAKAAARSSQAASAAATAAAAAANAAAAQGPPSSSAMTSVWYWLLDGNPTTVMYYKPKREVWCDGYLIETYEGFDDGVGDDLDVGDVIDFSIFSAASQRNHRGRIERVPLSERSWPGCETADDMCVGTHRLWVDDCQVPEYCTDQQQNYDNGHCFTEEYDYDDEYSLDSDYGLSSSMNETKKRLV